MLTKSIINADLYYYSHYLHHFQTNKLITNNYEIFVKLDADRILFSDSSLSTIAVSKHRQQIYEIAHQTSSNQNDEVLLFHDRCSSAPEAKGTLTKFWSLNSTGFPHTVG